ncbi:DUF2790 domain-containing protein [Pseudomonas sp. UL073]|uniref:DUF2790 domain-containing protein n=1 Tax=Zestomonas insulae TaxID=2809017 RepID=A0ABS2IB78_9GAMM|nr:DUF2790 domain-containing protein [Pseudomonas insulae]MBM7059090.1 DUF2790 domain-containing protein [Pseudomonas insulae]
MNKLISFIVLALAATSSLAANDSTATGQAVQYHYGMQLDIAEVVSITPLPTGCQVGPATMVYIDHQGQTHTVNYSVMGECWGSTND